MTILIGRPRPGTVGECRRLAHVFPEQPVHGGRVTTFCGQAFELAVLEWLPGIGGMPCEACLACIPKPHATIEP